MPTVACASCGATNNIVGGIGGFKCAACQRNNWIIACSKCKQPMQFWGEFRGTGIVTFKCRNCHRTNRFDKARLRTISANARAAASVARTQARQANAARRQADAAHKFDARAEKAAHVEQEMQDAQARSEEVRELLDALRRLLPDSLDSPSPLSLASYTEEAEEKVFEPPAGRPAPPERGQPPAPPVDPEPKLEDFLPAPSLKGRVLPGSRRHQEEQAQADLAEAMAGYHQRRADYDNALAAFNASWQSAETDYKRQSEEYERALDAARDEFDRQLSAARQAAATFVQHYASADPQVVVEFFTNLLDGLDWPFTADSARVAFSGASGQLVVEIQLPRYDDVIPAIAEYRYVQKTDSVTEKPLAERERKAIYSSLVAQIALRLAHEVFAADEPRIIESVVINGHVNTIDPKTGHAARPCLVTLRTDRDEFEAINLAAVDPIACLRGLKASLSRAPSELIPVKPVIEFDMVDPRFVTEAQVLGSLDARPNLMDLTPSEFESLVTNLFEKMGLETRLTQASRDGGVDCVAFDNRPIFGGKVVIQAKRYKHTVGVSAVRDLFGTMQNEGATKGILVTTSGYGSASFQFADGKPLELLDGTNLLYLLKEHAGVDAKIEVPDDWQDPVELD